MKRRSKYKLKLYDEAHLTDRGEMRVSWWGVTLCAIVAMAIFIAIGISIVWFTPLKKRLPGYMVPEQRNRTEETLLEVDSLQQLFLINEQYLENLRKVLDTEREPDVADTVNRSLPFRPDSLWEASEKEKEFIRKMAAAGYKVDLPAEEEEENENE